MNNNVDFPLPVFILNEVTPLLSRGDKVFAYEIKVTNESCGVFKIYENNGLDLSDYIGKKMECLVEITKGKFEHKAEHAKNPEDVVEFQYYWLRRPFEFFPELMKLRKNSNENILKQFDETALEFFKHWGLNGLGIDIYQTKPTLYSSTGIFLINEYEFEDEIEYLKLNQQVHIRIDELFLRGIRPIPDNSKQKEYLATKKVIVPPAPKPPEEPKQNKGRFNLFPDKNS